MRTEFRMHFPAFDWYPARRHLRQFAWLAALFLAVFSWAGETSSWTLSLRLAAAFLFAVGTVLPGLLRWPYLALLLLVSLFVRLFNRSVCAFSPPIPPRQDPGPPPKRFQEHHDRHPA